MQVNTQFYAFRWITLLLTQEFPFPDAVRLWDTLFSDTGGRQNCLLRICAAMLINLRNEIMQVCLLAACATCRMPVHLTEALPLCLSFCCLCQANMS